MITNYSKFECDKCGKVLTQDMLPKGWITISVSEMHEIGNPAIKKDCCKCAYKLLREFKFLNLKMFKGFI